MKLSERLQGLKEEISNEITLSPELENSMDRCIEGVRHLEGKVEVRENIEKGTIVYFGTGKESFRERVFNLTGEQKVAADEKFKEFMAARKLLNNENLEE